MKSGRNDIEFGVSKDHSMGVKSELDCTEVRK